jgi:hypothetical protein
VPLTELPFGFPGRIFRSPMPFGPYDLHGEVYDQFCEAQIAVIVLLAACRRENAMANPSSTIDPEKPHERIRQRPGA